jgi:hypothetical protein
MQSLEAQTLVQQSIGEQNQSKTEDGRCAANIVEGGPSMQYLEGGVRGAMEQPTGLSRFSRKMGIIRSCTSRSDNPSGPKKTTL